MNYEEIANEIPDDWYSQEELKEETAVQYQKILVSAAHLEGVEIQDESDIEPLIEQIAKKMNLSFELAKTVLFEQATSEALVVLFKDKYGHLLPKDTNGEVGFPLPILAKMAGKPVEETKQAFTTFVDIQGEGDLN